MGRLPCGKVVTTNQILFSGGSKMVMRDRGNSGKSDNCEGSVVGRCFFKVLIEGFHSTLYIPPAFAKRLVDDKSDRATLDGPIGSYQDIEVGEDSYSMFFHNRWQNFVGAHSLQCGEFLVFKYHGDLRFDVMIFDATGCEKIYRPAPRNDKDYIPRQPKRAPLSHVHRNQELPKSIRKRKTLPLRSSRLRKASESTEQTVEKSAEHVCKTEPFDDDDPREHDIQNIKRKSCATDTSLEATHPHFITNLTASTLVKSWIHVPADFTNRGVFIREGPVSVLDANSRTWPFLLRRLGKRSILCQAWSAFRNKHQLCAGDACIFRLVKGTNDVLDAVILRKINKNE